MKNNRKNICMNLRKILICIFAILLAISIFINIDIKAEETIDFDITIIYKNETQSIEKKSVYDSKLKSVELADYNESNGEDFYEWTPTTLIDGIYEQAFAGWKLIKIDNNEINGNYFYPDNDYIYSNDKPFNEYKFTSSTILTFQPIYGKRIYLRDKYNFVSINNVFGDDIATAKINWDTSKAYSYSIAEANVSLTDDIEYVGSSVNNPVSNLGDAFTLLGTTGGEIVTVNHYTIKNADNKYDYYDGAKKSGAYSVDFGKKVINGIVTYTGLDYGLAPDKSDLETEKKYEKENLKADFTERYKNSHWYCLNTRGNEGVNAHTFNFLFHSDTVLENLNIVGYREIYKTDGSRYNNQVYFYASANKRFVIMESFDAYQRVTSAANEGKESTNWGYCEFVLPDSTFCSRVSNGGKGYLQLFSGLNSKNNNEDNVYVTLKGNKRNNAYYDGFYHYSIVLKSSSISSGGTYKNAVVNNIHIYMSNYVINSDFMGINQGLSATVKCNFYGVYLNNFENVSSSGFTSTVYNTKKTTIKDLIFVVDGDDSTQSLVSTFMGGMLETTGNDTSTVIIDNAEVLVKNKGKISSLYGGGNQFAIATIINNNLIMNIDGGTITDLYGGCQGGTISANKIEININGGTITNLYGGGAGGFVNCYNANSPINISNYNYSDDYKFFAYESSSSKNVYIYGVSIGLDQQIVTLGENTSTFDVLTFQQVIHKGTTKAELNNYYSTPLNICVSNALVTTEEGIHININGGIVKSNVYGGGLNGAVNSNIVIKMTGGNVSGDIFGGGSGKQKEFSAKEFLASGEFYKDLRNNNYDIKYTSNKDALNSEKFTEALNNSSNTVYQKQIQFLRDKGYSQTFIDKYAKVIIQSSDLQYLDLLETDDKGNKYIEVYSDVIETLGSIVGNTNLQITGGTINGDIFGGSDGEVANIQGSTFVDMSGGTVKGNIYGGGNIAVVSQDSNVSVSESNISYVYGGGNVGSIEGNTQVIINGTANIKNVFAGSNQANVGGTSTLIINDGKVTNAFGGNNLSGEISEGIITQINGGEIESVYGGGNEADTKLDTSVIVKGGKITSLYGGGNNAKAKNSRVEISEEVGQTEITNLYGGGYAKDIEGNSEVIIHIGTIKESVYGGGYEGHIQGNTKIEINNGSIKNIYGGGFQGAVYKDSKITVNEGNIEENIYGGGYAGNIIGSSEIKINNGSIEENIYGGGYEGHIQGNTRIEINNGRIKNIYGGGYKGKIEGIAQIEINDGSIEESIYGGGYQGDIQKSDIKLNGGQINKNVYGGGYAGDVTSGVEIEENGSIVGESIYGGGYEGHIEGQTTIEVTKGKVNKNIYGGGYAGEVEKTEVKIEEAEGSYGEIEIKGSVFGGGEGITARVSESTKVQIKLNLDQTVEEIEVDTESRTTTSGESACEVSLREGYSYIDGSVYGGGDLGQIGIGEINTSSNNATISKGGRSEVVVENGYIGGSVFGGGSGIPKEETYRLEMGTIYGSTKVEIKGGYIETNVYGGGTQSRVYFDNGGNEEITKATEVIIDETESNEKIVIGGSVFGGGDRGNSATTNASVPTTIGDVSVKIKGKGSGSKIYFLTGGVYGDGNLCLVRGRRTIELIDYTTSTSTKLKTFRSLQRADEVVLTNTDIVLLGAVDLVEEGDNTVYSINRVKELRLEKGSTIKLDQVVKYLENIESDYEFISGDNTKTRKFIDKGNNGENGYKTEGGINPNPLTEEEIEKYQEGSEVSILKNVICVANGLYLEIMTEENKYGKVEGLFTLQLLYANEGEGGGFVYASIQESTGGFICETRYGNDRPYMKIIGNVSGLENTKYTYYCWFIQGDTINYTLGITGYIGSDEKSYEETSIIPEHNEKLNYVLNKIEVNEVLKNALINGKYILKQAKNLEGEDEISLEVYIGNVSVGYLQYENEKWYISGKEGYESEIEKFKASILLSTEIENGRNLISVVLHKSKEVNKETNNMQVAIEIDLLKDDGLLYSNGTSKLKYKIGFSIVRLVPEQTIYTGSDKMYSGLTKSETIKITNGSSFSIEYQTRYIPVAFPDGSTEMKWMLSTKGYSYYIDELGNYMTLDSNGNVISISPLLTMSKEAGKIEVIKNQNGEYEYKHDNKTIKMELVSQVQETYIPKGTKIILIDMTLSTTPTYYYYICNEEKQEIDLKEFYIMGTQRTIEESGKVAEYEKQYISQLAQRVTERLIFVFDLEQVEESEYRNLVDEEYIGNIVLSHKYGNIDIMDYVKSETNNDVTTYTRSTPKVAPYQVNLNKSGIEEFEIEFKEEAYEKGEVAHIDIVVKKDEVYTNTQLKEGKIGIKIEVEGLGELPDGIEFQYGGSFLPKYGNKYIIIPIKNYGEYSIEIVNVLGTIETDEALKQAKYQGTLCYLPDEQYYNETIVKANTITDTNIKCEITEKIEKSFKVEVEKSYVTQGEKEIEIKVYEKNTTEETTLKVYYKTDTAIIETREIYILNKIEGNENGKINIIQISSQIEKGVYELVFTNGEKQEVVTILIN